jgi:NAD(P)H-nitrite reductase large subunit
MAQNPARRILVVGGGPAGVFAAMEAKRSDPGAQVTLLTEEPCEPYEKPPLSKGVLCGKCLPEHAPIAGHKGIGAHDIVLECGACCTAIDRAAHQVMTASGRAFPYDALILALGSVVRQLPQWPIGMRRVHYLRTEKDARALAAAMQPGKHLVIVGGGLIGLEVAASAATAGVRTTVLEVGPRILARVCDEATGAFVADAHRRHGVELHTGDMTRLPFPDAAFDVVVSSMAIHNITDAEARLRAIDEAARVLRPGGKLLIADFRYTPDYAARLRAAGLTAVEERGLGWRFMYGGPWTAVRLVKAARAG